MQLLHSTFAKFLLLFKKRTTPFHYFKQRITLELAKPVTQPGRKGKDNTRIVDTKFILSAGSAPELKKTNAPGYMLFVALLILISGLIIDFAALLYKNDLHLAVFLLVYAIGLAAIINAVRLLNTVNHNPKG